MRGEEGCGVAVLVLNADLGPLHHVSVKHAVRMLLRQVAEVHEAEPDRIIGVFPVPRVLRLVTYVVTRWRHNHDPHWSRRRVLDRDQRRCGYCGHRATTVDHIVPRSRGGADTWCNTIAACNSCNQRKRDRTPAEAGMHLRFRPAVPAWPAAFASR